MAKKIKKASKLNFLCKLNKEQEFQLCRWISITEELSLISKEKTSHLDFKTYIMWKQTAKYNLYAQKGTQIIGYISLSNSEAKLPVDTIEFCHLIVKPSLREQCIATIMASNLLHIAKDMGYKRVVARVMKDNVIAKRVLKRLNFLKTRKSYSDPQDNMFWFERKISG